ncbi:GNAT family N-acetyltransferase [Kribbella sp.]|uniref:GNAT family N-acetyltransferase n=1 Tax=Kribbella sp. TaxID=1871183 RepID=UPI002D3CB9BE|nr:GNAT family N-acetyltransferase [Kribbella sp.]HZX03973.1 GNAT family N-acetyltransferase [Kribbella sp.]
MFVRTERLTVRRFSSADAERFAAYRSDPAVAHFQGWEAPVSLADAQQQVERFAQADPEAAGWFQYAVALDGVLIGDLGVNLHENLMQADIGFTFATEYQGQGYASEAVRGLLQYLFVDRALHKVSAECDARNTASALLLERVGFTREGLRLSHTWFKGEWTDDLLYGYLNPQQPTRGQSA